VTDEDGGAILASYETREKKPFLNETVGLSLHLRAGKSSEIQDNSFSISSRPRTLPRRSGRAKKAVSTLPSLADLPKLNPSYAGPSYPVMAFISSIGNGKMIVEVFSEEIANMVCKYRSWRAMGFLARMSDASARRADA
jgi:hypothetical protein